MFVIVDILKALACIFIFLYHCNTILPGEWRFITVFGEDAGNCLFFMVSGFALYGSIRKTETGSFLPWYLKRLKRILPMLLTAYLAAYLFGYYGFNDPAQIFAVFVYPTLYWFATAILWFYIILFLMAKLLPEKGILFAAVLFFVLRCLREGTVDSHYFLGLTAMLLGYYIRFLCEKAGERPGAVLALAGLMSLAGYVLVKGMYENGVHRQAAYILMGVLVLFFCGFTLAGGAVMNGRLKPFSERHARVFAFVSTLGDMALPLYMVQCWCGGYIGFYILQKVAFPLSFWVNFAVIWSLTAVVYLVFYVRRK